MIRAGPADGAVSPLRAAISSVGFGPPAPNAARPAGLISRCVGGDYRRWVFTRTDAITLRFRRGGTEKVLSGRADPEGRIYPVPSAHRGEMPRSAVPRRAPLWLVAPSLPPRWPRSRSAPCRGAFLVIAGAVAIQSVVSISSRNSTWHSLPRAISTAAASTKRLGLGLPHACMKGLIAGQKSEEHRLMI